MNDRSGFQQSLSILLVFAGCLLISTLYSVNTKTSIPVFLHYLSGIIIFYGAFKIAQNDKYRKYNEYFLYLCVFYATIIAIVLLYQHFILHISRPNSIVRGVNIAARYLELVIPVIVSAILFKNLGSKRFLLMVMVLLTLFGGLFVTYTRGAWLATGFATVIILLVNKAYKTLIIGAILAAVIFSQDNSGLGRLASILQKDHSANMERIYVWTSSLEMIRDYFWTGIGLGNFQSIYVQYYMLPNAYEDLIHAHNVFLVFATEGGILTVISFVLFILSSSIFIFRGIKSMPDSNYRKLAIGMSMAAVALLIHGMVDSAFRKPLLWIIFMFELGFCFGLIKHYGYKVQCKLN